ncbi:hypothetical protein PBI_SCTP2_30 [Salicola phage SCTP-2]|nr:hypothetical protein PBI_SCTP2_30 [Salicola phage SCTP-2]
MAKQDYDYQNYVDICNIMDVDPNNDMSKKSQLYIINAINSNYIKFIKNPCKEAQIEAVKYCAALLNYIENPTGEAIHEVCHKHPLLIKLIKDKPNYNEDVFYNIIKDCVNPLKILYYNNDQIKITENILLLCLEKSWRISFYNHIQQLYPDQVNNKYFSHHIKKLKLVKGPLK